MDGEYRCQALNPLTGEAKFSDIAHLTIQGEFNLTLCLYWYYLLLHIHELPAQSTVTLNTSSTITFSSILFRYPFVLAKKLY